MIIFIKTPLKEKIKNFDSHIIKTGLMGAMGNKGSCLIRFDYLDTSFAFSTGHFAAGSSANSSRISELTEILNRNFPLYKEAKFKDHNIMFIFGDLNFRCDIDYHSCLSLIKAKNLPQLLQYDQFLKSKEVNFSLIDIEEGEINFNPTYKYIINTQDYDSKKKRVPSWCDRILYKKSKFVIQNIYERAEYTYSDHRPVYSVFNCYAMKDQLKHKKSLKNFKSIKHIGNEGHVGVNDQVYNVGNKDKKIDRNVSPDKFSNFQRKNTNNSYPYDYDVPDTKGTTGMNFNFKENKNLEKHELSNYASEEIINFFK
jgi:synaptojanin